MKSGEFTGRSIDEAVFHGLHEMGLSIDEVRIETLQNESKGIFGIGAKLARVRLTQRDTEEELLSSPAREESRPPRTDNRPPREESRAREDSRPPRTDSRPPREDNRPPRTDSRPPREDNRPPRTDSRPPREDNRPPRTDSRPPREDNRPPRTDSRPPREEDREPQLPTEQYNYSAEVAASHPAGQFLSGLLTQMGIEADIRAAETEDGVHISIDSKTKGLLIGRRGETLDAMQYLTSLVVNRSRKQEKYLRVTLDTEDYRSKREDTLIRLARRQAARVKSTGRPVAMEPMNPYERRVLHASLQNNPYVTTHSEGEEPNRRVVITPKK